MYVDFTKGIQFYFETKYEKKEVKSIKFGMKLISESQSTFGVK